MSKQRRSLRITPPALMANYFIPPVEAESPFLLDDDPFANLSGVPAQTPSTPKPSTQKSTQPRSPLSPVLSDRVPLSTPSSPPAAVQRHSRAWSKSISSRAPVPAHQKPAFAPKPSLPSLDALSRMNVVLPKKARRVGAGLPFEPWDNLDDISPLRSPDLPRQPTVPSGFVSDPNVDDGSSSLPVTLLDPPDQIGRSENVGVVAKSILFAAEHDPQPASLFGGMVESDPHHPDTAAHSFTIGHTSHALCPGISSGASSSSPPDTTLLLSHEEELEGSAFPYVTDTESSLPSLSPSGCSPDASVGSSLSRSTSNSSKSSDDLGSVTSSRYGNVWCDPSAQASADGEIHLLNSAVAEPNDYFSFPTASYTSETAVAISNWRHETHARAEHLDHDYTTDDNHQALDETISPFTSPHSVEPDISMYQPFSSSSIRGTRTARPQYANEYYDAEHDPYRGASGTGGRMNGGHPSSQARSNGLGKSLTLASRRGGSGNGHDDEDDRNGRKPSRPSPSMFSNSSSSEETSEEEEESADDNVPLAQSIPTALTAQKSIRKQVRDERDQRRRERAERAAGEARSRQTTLRPAGAGRPVVAQAALSSSQEAMLHAHSSSSAKPTTRQRTLTLPGRVTSPFSPDDLAKKLQDVQASSPVHRRQTSGEAAPTDVDKNIAGTSTKDLVFSQPLKQLRPSRSFHRPHARVPVEDHSVPVPSVPVTVAAPPVRLARSQSRHREEKLTFEDAQRVPVPQISSEHRRFRSVSSRPSMEADRERGRSKRPSTGERRPSTADRDHRPPMPPPPSTMPEIKHVTQQQRVFIGDMQRYNVVEIDDTTPAGDVVQMIEAQGSLKGLIGSGDWMVWEIAHDFGVERPIRHFERLSDVQASWNKDKLVNMFVLRLTSLAPLLSRSAIPSSSPTHAGYVEWESKRGKWSKRWLQLREHSLWLSKRDNTKLFCVRYPTLMPIIFSRSYKAPKSFAFAIKSTDKLSFFEDTSDYKHVISCSEKDGKVWMEKILLARSYVLHQERNILFNPRSYGGQPTTTSTSTIMSGGVSRAQTLRRPSHPFVSVPNSDPFEPGSLLHRKS
ncbi:hypothetical protein AGABI1DRAFT_128397 [Agaricus bisporus var. burnettii JB137-S8]|uniref:PH domain-containing protein n=1 Tax=Agaricus bisporus var. burnettii (strain JB137-S8 / ATCC MYA-4627 / FGSC 10392) TaxID=597362 RepID=K5X7R3_AGABU|nr:uncharacterized protein AGABI1DRAFT_128397 [Agaricus bisporus var. burnettii JB137-S8]EKM79238.1 hypothetical protein AGABI1DRAFT_128397 [Agaricus bisporus var. burnettii JB137-S8]